MTINDIHNQAVECASECNRSEVAMIEALQAVIKNQVHQALNYPNLHVYVTQALKLSDAQAYYFTRVALKATQVPELKAALDTGTLTVSQAKRIAPVITPLNSDVWITKAATLSQRVIEKQVAIANPKHCPPEKIKIMNEREAYLSTSISLETEEGLERLKDLFSQKISKACSLRDVIELMTQRTLEQLDPVKKAERNVMKSEQGHVTPISSLTSRSKSEPERTPTRAHVRHQVAIRDEARCTEIVNGIRCEQRRWLQVHHVKRVADGGENSSENLVTLCSFHHRKRHRTAQHSALQNEMAL